MPQLIKFQLCVIARIADMKSCTSLSLLNGESEARTSPSDIVPSASCMSGAQCSPPRTHMAHFSERREATASEGIPSTEKAAIPK